MQSRHLRRSVGTLAALLALAAQAAPQGPAAPEIEVFKSPYCGCCAGWVEHMRAAGFAVKVTPVTDTAATRKRLGLPERYASCHTATVGGYLLEGHVPAAEVRRLLSSKPKGLGLAVPGMPTSSPGMDVRGSKDPYKVLLVDAAGQSTVFASYPK